MATLQLRDLRKSYGSVEVIKGVNLDIADREFVVFVGPSGLRQVHAAAHDRGPGGDHRAATCMIDGKRVNQVGPADRGLAMVFQSYALYPHMTVRQNMAFALRLARVPKAERDRKVDEAARILQLEPYLERRPKDLSGGQRQRVAIGRAIVRQPKVFLFDEPLSNLDAALRGQMRIELLASARGTQRDHDLRHARPGRGDDDGRQDRRAAGRPRRAGRLAARAVSPSGQPVRRRLHRFAAHEPAGGQGGRSRRVRARRSRCRPDRASSVPVEAGTARTGDTVTLGIRPEGLHIDPAGPIAATVALVERLGGLTLLHVKADGNQEMTVQIEGSDPTRAHEQIRLAVDPAACHLFDKAGQALPHLVRHPLAA